LAYPLWKWLGKGRLRILQYHSVRDVPQGMKFPFNVTPAAFARQMEYLARNDYNIITFDELINYKQNGKKIPSKSVIITFDDGYVDNYLNAFPILKKHNFKATIFLVTDFIGSGRIFNWLKLDERLLDNYQEEKSSWLPLNMQSILDMQAQGMSFGAHTKTHCALDLVEEDKAIDEIVNSRNYLEDVLSKPVIYFAYPFDRVNEKIKGLVKESGYKIAVGGTGNNTLKSDFFNLKRIEIEKGDSLKKYARKVNGAYDWVGYLFSVKKFIIRFLSQMRRNEH
jgi:peptidoglycan/xylan/chitin deacetylase (PgdA/CDA1 family)